VETVVVEGREGRTTDFVGELVVPVVTTYRDDKPRWAEFRLYRKPDDEGYVIWRTGNSLIYHSIDSDCETRDGRESGFPKRVRDLDKDAEPCLKCQPPWPDQMPGDTEVRAEEPRHTVSHCKNAAEVVDSLTWDPKTKRRVWTEPVSELLMAANKADPAFQSISQSPTIRL